jgi:hypothetical protein
MWSFGIEASSVIALRMLKFASGGNGVDVEARRMVTEKIDAGLDIQRLAMTGALGASPVAPWSRRCLIIGAESVQTSAV